MKVRVTAAVTDRRHGVRASDATGTFVGHGDDEEEAIKSMERAARAWCNSLARAGVLPSALRRCGLAAEGEGDRVEVEVQAAHARSVHASKG